MSGFDFVARDRELKAAAAAAAKWRARLKVVPDPEDDPFAPHRSAVGRMAFLEVQELPELDPLRTPLLRWTHCLLEQRANRQWLIRAHQLRYAAEHGITEPVRGAFTWSAMLQGLFAEPAARASWWAALTAEAEPLSDVEWMIWQRRERIASELAIDPHSTLELPTQDIGSVAEACLGQLAPLLTEYRDLAPPEWVSVGLATKAAAAFPGRLNESVIADWLREARLLEALDLPTWELPRLHGASSFLRAMDELGGEYRRASAPTNQPFVVAHDPQGLENHSYGVCFASLLQNPDFLLRRLAVPRAAQRDLRRALAVSIALELALRALKVLLHPRPEETKVQLRERTRELIYELLGLEVPLGCALVWPRLRPNDAQRFAGVALGWAVAERLSEAHDQDWYRNPRAVDQLRAEAALSPRVTIDSQALGESCEALIRGLTALV